MIRKLLALEESGCVSAETGWEPCHFVLFEDAQAVAVMPSYIKSNSFGEFVFDWGWAEAYQRHGLDYYPKLISAVPFSPVTGPRIGVVAGIKATDIYPQMIDAVQQLAERDIRVSLFIDPDPAQLDAAVDVGAPVVELHTGRYADSSGDEQATELQRVVTAARYGHDLGLVVNAGHGLHYQNVAKIAVIEQIVELNIGHAIISRAVFDGLSVAVGDMKLLMTKARGE